MQSREINQIILSGIFRILKADVEHYKKLADQGMIFSIILWGPGCLGCPHSAVMPQ